jgi:hypothetical protein
MAEAVFFWFLLFVPGWAVVRRWFPEVCAGGLLPVFAWSNVATLVLLSPVAIVGYLLQLPLVVFTGYWLILVLGGGAGLLVGRRRCDFRRMLRGLWSIEGLFLLANLVLAARVGGLFFDFEIDAMYHFARIRHLVDHGLSNQDPYFEFPGPVVWYHTNLLHALYAAGVQVTGVDHFTVWTMALPWARAFSFAAAFTLGWVVFGRRWAAWCTGLALWVPHLGFSALIYPNWLSVLALLPLTLAAATTQVAYPTRWRYAGLISAILLVLGQVHGLYAAFAGLLAGPPIAAAYLYQVIRRRRWHQPLLYGVLGFALGAPFIVASLVLEKTSHQPRPNGPTEPLVDEATVVALTTAPAVPTTQASPASSLPRRPDWFEQRPDGRRVMRMRAVFPYHDAPRASLLAIGVGAAAVLGSRRRRYAFVLVTASGIAALALLEPHTCSFLLELTGREFIVARLRTVLMFALAGLVFGHAAYRLEPLTKQAWAGPWRRPLVR